MSVTLIDGTHRMAPTETKTNCNRMASYPSKRNKPLEAAPHQLRSRPALRPDPAIRGRVVLTSTNW